MSLSSAAWRQIAWRHPEWWALGLSAIAWLAILLRHNSHAHHHSGGESSWILDGFNWMLMVIAMMVPLVSGSIRDTAARSLWARRQRAVAGFMAGYLTIWLLAGLAICAAVEGLRWVHWNPAIAVVVAFCIAAVWQLTPAKTRALRSCHRTLPLAPLGWSADRDSVRFGRLIGVACVGSCWALMAACAATGHSVLGMTFASCVCFAERYQFRPNQRVLAGVIAGFAAIFGVTALF